MVGINAAALLVSLVHVSMLLFLWSGEASIWGLGSQSFRSGIIIQAGGGNLTLVSFFFFNHFLCATVGNLLLPLGDLWNCELKVVNFV